MKNKKIPMRRCIGCMESKPKSELIRIVFNNGILTVDIDSRKDGRGAYLCKSEKCFEKALKKRAFNRTFRTEIEAQQTEKVIEELREITKEV